MLARTTLNALFAAVVMAGAAAAQMPEKGLIIRVVDHLVFIDLGQADGVREGDIFDILDAEVVTHPLSGDTLSVRPTSVGALRVRQVFAKMSLAELLHLQAGKDPMLMRVAPIGDPDRLMEVERFLGQRVAGGAPSRRAALVPGLYQYRLGDKKKGMGLLGLEVAALAAGIGYRLSSDDWFAQYEELPPGLPQEDYDFYFEGASDRRTTSNRLFMLAGAVYAYNLIDVLWTGGAAPANARHRLEAGLSRTGAALLRFAHRF